ncbi:MAG: DUF131 domain-containing protein [Candidatus Bathyarchaeota archaeon]|nr:DUF131 domain-containing protein [Candidatus Bathyarchaeota archaeon]
MDLDAGSFYSLGIALVFVGILIVLVAFALLFMAGFGEKTVRGGGTVIIGPFPIIFGTDKESVKTILWLSITLTVLLIAFFIIFNFLLG